MCGFAGFIDFDRDPRGRNERLSVLQAMSTQIAHRGPDDAQLLDDDCISIAFRRLSIIDVNGGRQPIWNEDETMFVCVNGEIYNHKALRAELKNDHRFRTESDSEIVLHLYEEIGVEAIARLAGKFSIAIWDRTRRRAVFARDRLGVKPLYFAQFKHGLLFGSELKALLVHRQCPRDLRWSDLARDEVSLERVPTYLHGVEFLHGGHTAVFDERGLHVERYWSLESAFTSSQANTLSSREYVERYRDLFLDSVQMRLMSDVPVGAFLSGGIDSAAVVGAAASLSHRLPCFNVLTQTTARNGDAVGARATAQRLGLEFHQVMYDESELAGDLGLSLEAFETYVWMMDSPRFNVGWLYRHQLHRFVKRHFPDMKVILLGEGADEFAGGYSHQFAKGTTWTSYLHTLRLDQRRRSGVPGDFLDLMSGATDDGVFRDEMRYRLSILQWHNLWHEDRTAALEGIESRLPFLDHHLVELLASIPEHLHQELFWDKRIVREAARAWVPDSVVNRPKVPFFMAQDMRPVHHLLRDLAVDSFPEFRDKYLSSSESLFDAGRLEVLSRAAVSVAPFGSRALDTLVRCMCVAVFSRMCADVSAFGRQALAKQPVLSEVSRVPEAWVDPPSVAEEGGWRSADRAELVQGATLAVRLGEGGPFALLCWDERIEETLELPNERLLDLLKRVADPTASHTVEALARAVDTDENDVSYALQFFRERGWIERRIGG